MAVIKPTQNNDITKAREVVVVTWNPLANGDVGAAISLAEYADKTYQITGTLGAGGTVVIEGSNDGDNWATLGNLQGALMSFTAAQISTSQDKPAYVRPRVTAGDGTTLLTVSAACHRIDMSCVG